MMKMPRAFRWFWIIGGGTLMILGAANGTPMASLAGAFHLALGLISENR